MAVCGNIVCAIAHGKAVVEKKRRRELRETKQRIKTKSQWTKEAQAAVNAWVRWRDRLLPCISCPKPATWSGQWHASHYRSTGAHPELRFEEVNIHKACSVCNGHRSGNLIDYRIGLLDRIGPERVAQLEGPHQPKRYTIDDLREIRDTYRAKLREAKKSA